MDYKDYAAGQTNDHFWFKAKKDLIATLMEKTCGDKKHLKILSIGVGTGDDLDILNQYGDNYVIDIDEVSLAVIDDKLCVEKKLRMPVCYRMKRIFLMWLYLVMYLNI